MSDALSVVSPRGILKTAASRAEKRQVQHREQTNALLRRSPVTFKVLVLGGPGVGKSSLLRAAGGKALDAGEHLSYSPTQTPEFSTLLAATFRGRAVYLQLWEVPFALLAAEAAHGGSESTGGGSSAAAGGAGGNARRYPCSGHLDVAFAGAHAAVLVVDAREACSPGSQPLCVPYQLFAAGGGAGGGHRECFWTGSSLEACDLARRVLHKRALGAAAAAAAAGRSSSSAMPLYLLVHKADHPAALAASLNTVFLASQASAAASEAAVAAAAAAVATASSSSSSVPTLERKLSGVFEDFFAAGGTASGGSGGDGDAAAASGTSSDSHATASALGVKAGGALTAAAAAAAAGGGGLLAWMHCSQLAPHSGHGVEYLRFLGGGALTPGDLTRYTRECGFRGWGWGSVLSALSHAPPPPSVLCPAAAVGARGSTSTSALDAAASVLELLGREEEAGSRSSSSSSQGAPGAAGAAGAAAKGASGRASERRASSFAASLFSSRPPLPPPLAPSGGSRAQGSQRSLSFAFPTVPGGAPLPPPGGAAVAGCLEGELSRRLAGVVSTLPLSTPSHSTAEDGRARSALAAPAAPKRAPARAAAPPQAVLLPPAASLKSFLALITDDLLEAQGFTARLVGSKLDA
jgi:hypothetical protein